MCSCQCLLERQVQHFVLFMGISLNNMAYTTASNCLRVQAIQDNTIKPAFGSCWIWSFSQECDKMLAVISTTLWSYVQLKFGNLPKVHTPNSAGWLNDCKNIIWHIKACLGKPFDVTCKFVWQAFAVFIHALLWCRQLETGNVQRSIPCFPILQYNVQSEHVWNFHLFWSYLCKNALQIYTMASCLQLLSVES